MLIVPQHSGYWLASDGNWYPDYMHPGYGFYNAANGKPNRKATTTLVAGIATTFVVLIPEQARTAMGRPIWMTLTVLTSMACVYGTIAGIMALREISHTGERGRAQAIVGLIPCLFLLLVEVVVITIYIVGFILLGGVRF